MRTQDYLNHRRRVPPAYAVAGVAILTWAGFNLWQAVTVPSCGAWLAAVGTASLLVVWYAARRNAQVMQDRIIRLEMQIRLARLLPGRDVSGLTLPQLVALRFASDAEMPLLIDRVLLGELAKPDAIKRAIVNWQADWLRV